MRITVKSFASLACHAPEAGYLDMPEGSTAADVIAALHIIPAQVKIVFLNGKHSSFEASLQDGDRIGIMPAVGGG